MLRTDCCQAVHHGRGAARAFLYSMQPARNQSLGNCFSWIFIALFNKLLSRHISIDVFFVGALSDSYDSHITPPNHSMFWGCIGKRINGCTDCTRFNSLKKARPSALMQVRPCTTTKQLGRTSCRLAKDRWVAVVQPQHKNSSRPSRSLSTKHFLFRVVHTLLSPLGSYKDKCNGLFFL